MYLIGIVTATVVALILKKTLLRGPTPPFVMELPSYKVPALSIVLHRMLERGWSFVRRRDLDRGGGRRRVGESLLSAQSGDRGPLRRRRGAAAQLEALPATATERQAIEEQMAAIDHRIAGAYQQQSWLGRIGHWIEPAVRPLGWDWRIGCAAIASFPAREVVVATLGIIYNLGEVDVEIRATPDWTTR